MSQCNHWFQYELYICYLCSKWYIRTTLSCKTWHVYYTPMYDFLGRKLTQIRYVWNLLLAANLHSELWDIYKGCLIIIKLYQFPIIAFKYYLTWFGIGKQYIPLNLHACNVNLLSRIMHIFTVIYWIYMWRV
jgi:hypothetical protein